MLNNTIFRFGKKFSSIGHFVWARIRKKDFVYAKTYLISFLLYPKWIENDFLTIPIGKSKMRQFSTYTIEKESAKEFNIVIEVGNTWCCTCDNWAYLLVPLTLTVSISGSSQRLAIVLNSVSVSTVYNNNYQKA